MVDVQAATGGAAAFAALTRSGVELSDRGVGDGLYLEDEVLVGGGGG